MSEQEPWHGNVMKSVPRESQQIVDSGLPYAWLFLLPILILGAYLLRGCLA